MPIPEDKQSFPLCTRAGRLLGAEKTMWPHPINSVDMHRRPLWWDQCEGKVAHAAGEGPGMSGWGGWDPGEERGGGGGEGRGRWDPGEGGEERGRGPGVGRAGWDPGQGRKGVEKQGGAGPAKVGPPGRGCEVGP